MVEILRLWSIGCLDDLTPNVDKLYKRPRVDYRISEYVFDYINKSILGKYKIMQTGDYKITLSFDYYHEEDHKYHEPNIFDTDTAKYSLHSANATENGIKYKWILILCFSNVITEKITPSEYADIVYDMFGAYLTKKYKKITKELMDKNKSGLDYKIIEQYNYPALFKDQKYDYDDGTLYDIEVEKEYIKHYGE
jgi:hypothetical protein